MASITQVTGPDHFQSLLTSASPSTTLVLTFFADWAAPCAQMSTILSTLAPTYSPSALHVLSVDAEAHPDISESYDVSAVPFLVLIKGGKTVDTLSGSDAKKVRDLVERVAGKPGANKAGPQQIIPPALVPGEPAPERETPITKDLSGYAAPEGQTGAPDKAPVEEKKESKEELHARLETLVKAAPVMLFMKGTPSAPQCGFSRQLVGLLREHNVRYGFFNILADEDVRQGMKEFADWPTFPQLWVGGELVGGLDIVKEEYQSNPGFLDAYTASKQNGTVAT